jgi:hypothetical protein
MPSDPGARLTLPSYDDAYCRFLQDAVRGFVQDHYLLGEIETVRDRHAGTSNGSIAVYAKGATTPSNTLSDPAIKSANGIAVDGVGNIFLNYVGLV